MNNINCAVYVRKSTEAGLEQKFNSLHNQEEACKAYIASQSFNKWQYYKTYQDGGISGASMNRPGLQKMLTDMEQGKINVVVVYKVDRLSRSIMDFHNMMKEFEKHKCDFVSITQAFDTSNSMGKLTLNMLLSFAQFEREVSGERVRDKITASKARGMWTGAFPPLGYDIVEKKLIKNETEIPKVKFIYEKYLELKSISELRKYLLTTNIRSKRWITKDKKIIGGSKICSSILNRILRDKVYIGKIEHKVNKTVHNGRHEGILDKELFFKVQNLLDINRDKENSKYSKNGYLLSNLIMDKDGNVFKNQRGTKANKSYRYYKIQGLYLPASDLEEITTQTIKDFLNYDLDKIISKEKVLEFKSINFESLDLKMQYDLIRNMIEKVIYEENKLTYFIDLENLSKLQEFKAQNYLNNMSNRRLEKIYLSNNKNQIIIEKEIYINNRCSTNRYAAQGTQILTKKENNNGLMKALVYGWQYKQMYEKGASVDNIGVTEHKSNRTVYKYLNLAYLSPNIINDIMNLTVPSHINLQKLFAVSSKYTDFQYQEKAFYSTT